MLTITIAHPDFKASRAVGCENDLPAVGRILWTEVLICRGDNHLPCIALPLCICQVYSPDIRVDQHLPKGEALAFGRNRRINRLLAGGNHSLRGASGGRNSPQATAIHS